VNYPAGADPWHNFCDGSRANRPKRVGRGRGITAFQGGSGDDPAKAKDKDKYLAPAVRYNGSLTQYVTGT